MTLRSSSWVELTENNKRRLWQWCLSLFLFLLCNTVLFLVLLMSMDEARYVMDYGSEAGQMMLADARNYAVEMIGASAFRIIVTTIIAALTAFGGFAYLNDRVKLDFYESVPVKKGSRFSTVWVSGILIYAGPYIFSTLLCFAILNVTGYGTVYSMEEALIAFGQLMLYFLGVYHLFMLAMMLTGTTFAGVCAFIVLSVYEPVIRMLLGALRSTFFTYSYILENSFVPLLSPYGLMMNILNPKSYSRGSLWYAAVLLILDIVLFLLALILYMNRRSEAAGRTLAFTHTAVPLKLLIGIPVVVFAGLAVAGILNRSRDLNMTDKGLIAGICVITSIVTCAIIQAVFELDIRASLKGKFQWFICAAAGLLIFFGYDYDPLNLDRYVPAADKVESVVFIPNGYDEIYGWMDEDHEYMSCDDFALTHMFLSDVQDVCDLHRMSMLKYDELIKTIDNYEYEYDEDRRFSSAEVIYRLKNGRLLSRQLYVPVKDDNASYLLDKIMSNSDFVNGYYPMLAVDTDRVVDETPYAELNAYYTDCVHTQVLTGDELKELLRMYRKDMEDYSYTERLEELPAGYLDFCLAGERNGSLRYYGTSCQSITVYSGMENCLSYLSENGFDFADMPLAVEASQIVITNYHQEEQDARAKELGVPYLSAEESEEFVRMETYEPADDDEDDGMNDFALIASALHPCDRGTYRWDGGKAYDPKYEVTVFTKNMRNSPYGISCCFVEGEVPEFVMEDLEL